MTRKSTDSPEVINSTAPLRDRIAAAMKRDKSRHIAENGGAARADTDGPYDGYVPLTELLYVVEHDQVLVDARAGKPSRSHEILSAADASILGWALPETVAQLEKDYGLKGPLVRRYLLALPGCAPSHYLAFERNPAIKQYEVKISYVHRDEPYKPV